MEFKNIDPHEPMIRTQFHAFIDSINHCLTSKYFHVTLRRYLEACGHTEPLTPEQITAHRYTHENYWNWYAKQKEKAEQMQIEENMEPIMEELISGHVTDKNYKIYSRSITDLADIWSYCGIIIAKTARHALKAHVEGSVCDTRDMEFKVEEEK